MSSYRESARYALVPLLMIYCGMTSSIVVADEMEAYLQKRVEEKPDHSDSWRLLGKHLHRKQNTTAAADAFAKALELDPDNVAALFDLGQLELDAGDRSSAQQKFQRIFQIAPASSYADQLREQGHAETQETATTTPYETALYELEDSDEILQAGYEIQTFDSSEDLDRRIRELDEELAHPERRLRVFLETGILWNSNVTLTPISRQLNNANAASFQGFINPDVEWVAWDGGDRRAGPIGRGYFSVNESDFQAFDLTSFQPGLFYEQDLWWGETTHIARVEYTYSFDLLGGDRFGDRHLATASLTTILPDFDAIYSYVTLSNAIFDAPVANPAVASLDGPGVMFGMSRFFRTELPLLPTWSLGADFDFVNTEGDDNRYFGAKIHADATIQLAENLEFVPGGNIGFRNYADFTGTPDRGAELTYRLSSRLRYRFSEMWSVSAVLNYDRFASDNPLFDSERFETGVVTTLQY